MIMTSAAIPDALVLQPRVAGDERGFFESVHARRFEELSGRSAGTIRRRRSPTCFRDCPAAPLVDLADLQRFGRLPEWRRAAPVHAMRPMKMVAR